MGKMSNQACRFVQRHTWNHNKHYERFNVIMEIVAKIGKLCLQYSKVCGVNIIFYRRNMLLHSAKFEDRDIFDYCKELYVFLPCSTDLHSVKRQNFLHSLRISMIFSMDMFKNLSIFLSFDKFYVVYSHSTQEQTSFLTLVEDIPDLQYGLV
jgi:hypothetical protein